VLYVVPLKGCSGKTTCSIVDVMPEGWEDVSKSSRRPTLRHKTAGTGMKIDDYMDLSYEEEREYEIDPKALKAAQDELNPAIKKVCKEDHEECHCSLPAICTSNVVAVGKDSMAFVMECSQGEAASTGESAPVPKCIAH
jgi:hypothetical protein